MSLPFPMGGSPYWLVNSNFGIDAGVCSQDQLQQAIQLQYSGNQEGSSSSTSGGVVGVPRSFLCCESLESEFEKQRQEIGWLLQFENQELRTAVQDITRQQTGFLQRYESRIFDLFRQKEQGLEAARNRSVELQKLLEKAEMEVQAWQKKAMDNEVMVLDLNNRIDLLVRESNLSIHNGGQDAESFTDPSFRDCRTQELLRFRKRACKLCNARRQCVVFLPCRHLCSCRVCESLLALCPVCESVKQASMEVFLA